MIGKLSKIINLARNMGWRYVSFRGRYELMRRCGLLKSKFPPAPAYKQYLALDEWKKQGAHFFFESREALSILKDPQPSLKETYNNIQNGKLLLFSSLLTDMGKDYDWVTNPDSGHKYDVSKHWTEIADYSKEAGDIKFVWEKSRFSYLYDVIRYDYHFGEDCAQQVFDDILSWIKSNPVNCGPNYRCSQEMSLRVLNWTFALNYYKNSKALTAAVFDQIQYAIYWHMDHVYKNIDFSRIAVRNNHAITETLALYLAGLFYPNMQGAKGWKDRGKKWFEEEIAYQVYEDGTFLQFSMNYHRIVVQLLTWGIVLAEKNGERFSEVVYDRAKKSVMFLRACMVDENGWLPNYGANDGALFFKLNAGHYRDYRPQLQALAAALGLDADLPAREDVAWYGIQKKTKEHVVVKNGMHSFNEGGYYIIREPETLTFIKCGSYRDRPQHADNLHMDVWYKGENVLMDAGSYKYNTDDATIRYFSGTRSHNTVMLDDNDQMLKGGRFIWYYWTQCVDAELSEGSETYVFSGAIMAFSYVRDGIVHRRTVTKPKGLPVWQVKDEITGAPDSVEVRQYWHMPFTITDKIRVSAFNGRLKELALQEGDGRYSSLYGREEKHREVCFSDRSGVVETIIEIETGA